MPEPRPRRQFTYDPRAGRYRYKSSGRFVSRTVIRDALDAALESRRNRMRLLSEQLVNGEISTFRWYREMRRAIKDVHIYSAALAEGGWDRFRPEQWGRVGALIRDEYRYLARFRAQIASGQQLLDGSFLARVELYLEAGRSTHHVFEREVMIEIGMAEERNVLQPADHCSECVELTERGWVPIGELPPIGKRICKSRCRCYVEYREAAEAGTLQVTPVDDDQGIGFEITAAKGVG
jgi:hypothetical protein